MKLLYEKSNFLFKVDTNQANFMVYRNSEKYIRPHIVTIVDFNIKFDHMIQQVNGHGIKLPDAVLVPIFEKIIKNR